MYGVGNNSTFGFPSSGAGQFSSSQHSHSLLGGINSPGGLVSPNSSGLGMGLTPQVTGGSGSPIYQSPSVNKFPAGGGPVVFTPHSQAVLPGNVTNVMSPTSPYAYIGGAASSFIQSPSSMLVGPTGVYPPPVHSSTLLTANSPHFNQVTSPITHGYGHGQLTQYSSAQPYGYGHGSKVMAGAYYSPPYQQHVHSHHSPRDELSEPMHCSPLGQAQSNTFGGLQYQQQHRNLHSPPRSQYIPAFLTGVDAIAAVQTRPRRVFDRSPSTSPPAGAPSGSRSPQSKSPNWSQQEGAHPSGAGFPIQVESGSSAGGGIYSKRSQAQGPNRQLRFGDNQNVQNGTEDKDKGRKSGPPIRGFGSTDDASSFLNSLLSKESGGVVPGAAIAQEAISKAGSRARPTAESNWITVFGFPPAAASFIYTHFSQKGPIVQSKCNPGGNWLHIQYSSIIDARKALACNGKVLGGTIMVGVISSPREVIELYEKPQEERQVNLDYSSTIDRSTSQHQFLPKSPLHEKNLEMSTSSKTSESIKSRGIRPLAGPSQLTSPGGGERSFVGTNELNVSALSPGNENIPLPTSSSGILTKAMEYMFGW